MNNKHIYTHDFSAKIVDMFEDVLSSYDIKVPSPEDDDREEDNEACLYGSVYSDLLDRIEFDVIDLLEKQKSGCDVIPYVFSGNY